MTYVNKVKLINKNFTFWIVLDVAFNVGPKTEYKYLAISMHYVNRIDNDSSGFALKFADEPFVFSY
jgi:hypothetical protein